MKNIVLKVKIVEKFISNGSCSGVYRCLYKFGDCWSRNFLLVNIPENANKREISSIIDKRAKEDIIEKLMMSTYWEPKQIIEF